MDAFMMTRSSWCKNCHDNNRPEVGNLFALYQGTKNQIITQKVGNRTIWGTAITKGMTPHLFSLVKAKDDEVHYMCNCLINGCGAVIKQKVDEETGEIGIVFDFLNTKHGTMSVKDWNSLINRWHGYVGYEI